MTAASRTFQLTTTSTKTWRCSTCRSCRAVTYFPMSCHIRSVSVVELMYDLEIAALNSSYILNIAQFTSSYEISQCGCHKRMYQISSRHRGKGKLKHKGKRGCVWPLLVNTPLRCLGVAHVLKGSHSFTCTPCVHLLTEWTIHLHLPSQLKLVFIYRPRRDWRLSWPGGRYAW